LKEENNHGTMIGNLKVGKVFGENFLIDDGNKGVKNAEEELNKLNPRNPDLEGIGKSK